MPIEYGKVDKLMTQNMREDGLLPPELDAMFTDEITAKLCLRAQDDALNALGIIARLWPHDRQITFDGDSTFVVQTAKLLFSRREREDDTDPREALSVIYRAILAATDPVHGCSSKEKREHLRDIIARLEVVFGVAYSHELGSLAGKQAIDLNKAGAGFAGGRVRHDVFVQPDDVPAELRDITIAFWQHEHSKIAECYRASPTMAAHDDDSLNVLMDVARINVEDAIKQGAFIVPYDDMPPMQRQFWMQRAAGIDHDMNVLKRPPRTPPPVSA